MAETTTSSPVTGKTAADDSGPAAIAPATEFSPSGAPRQTSDIPIDHPAIDYNPRAGTTVNQNKIDMNDPHLKGHEAVEQNLKAQAKA